jgi:phosphoenolpyruvate carboxykinase (diphosphate)
MDWYSEDDDMDFAKSLGFQPDLSSAERAAQRAELLQYINLKLAANGLPIVPEAGGHELVERAAGLLANFGERTRLLADYRCPADERIEQFLARMFGDLAADDPLRLPGRTLILDRHGIARELSLPAGGDVFKNELIESYRIVNGVLHNPRADRRTTKGTFHIVEGGLPIAADKRSVPRSVFAAMFRRAVAPPSEYSLVPFTSELSQPGHAMVSLLLRPLVCPEVPGFCPRMTMETRFFAPASLVSNLDFVESIFGNAGDPFLPANDAGLDVDHWTGHTGCVILAPQLGTLTKKEVGLPHIDEASERQKRDRMCWEDESELYNDGQAFKITCRDDSGVVVTLISDNYFGYCKKEVKTQISYAANLMGHAEEEHAGGALVFQSWSLGETFQANSKRFNGRTFDDVVRDYSAWIDVQPEGYGIDINYPDLLYIPEDARADLRRQTISWKREGASQHIPLLPGRVYMAPSGYKIRLEKHPAAPSWRIIGTAADGTFCHKPCTVSGGGKSEISKSLNDYMQYGSVFVADYAEDMQWVEEIMSRDYSDRWNETARDEQNYGQYPSRPILSPRRTLGSVIKLLTPSAEYTDQFNDWLASIPEHIYAIVFAIKRFHHKEWGDQWRQHFGVDIVNGSPGHELKLHDRPIVGSYLRVGFADEGNWRTFKLRQDFAAAAKVQTEDDISASVVVPGQVVGVDTDLSLKFVENCEYRLFQRPDDAIHRGFDKQAEADLARRDVNFVSNFEPLTREVVEDMLTKVIDFDAFTEPMKRLLLSVAEGEAGYIVCSDNPRRIDGKPSKNPRYLQDRPDLMRPMDRYVAEMGARLYRAVPADQPVRMPVGAVLAGRRLNPPDPQAGIRGLAVYGPIHYQQLPELFMDYIASLTGKSPSTTGAGSEGALTKGPFNMLRPAADLNAALVSMILTGLDGFTSAAGFIGPQFRVDHDVSLLIPEIWCRLSPEERNAQRLIEDEMLEPVPDVTAGGESVSGHRLGYRITERFVAHYFGRVFDNPRRVFDDGLLRPETQDAAAFVDGVKQIREAHQRVARAYFADGTIDDLCPPLQTLVTIMAEGSWEGKDETHPDVRRLFTREAMLASDWYAARLDARQQQETSRWEKHIAYLERRAESQESAAADLTARLGHARGRLFHVCSREFHQSLIGTIGAQP